MALTSARFFLLRDKLMVRSLPISLREDVNHNHPVTSLSAVTSPPKNVEDQLQPLEVQISNERDKHKISR
jgi:hypothetical protein